MAERRPTPQQLLRLWKQACEEEPDLNARVVWFGNGIADWIENAPPAPLDELQLDSRTYNALRRSGISTVQAVERLNTQELMLIRCIGLNSAIAIRKALQRWRTTQRDGCRANASG